MPEIASLRVGAVIGLLGVVILPVATALHPSDADPNDAVAAFREYAADPFWVATHLGQFLGILLIAVRLMILARSLEVGPAGWRATLGSGGAVVSIAVAAVLQAVDGIVLKAMVDAWVRAPEGERATAFRAALAVRQIEIGTASLFEMVFGLTFAILGLAVAESGQYARWSGWVAVVGGLIATLGGVVMAHTGFSAPAMNLNLGSGAVLLAWVAVMTVLMWRRAGKVP